MNPTQGRTDTQPEPTVAIRADGNRTLASGHLRRCLSVAEELRTAGAGVFFCLADDESRRMLADMSEEAAGTAEILRSDPLSPAGEIPMLAEILRRHRTDVLLIDHYRIDDPYLDRIRSLLPEIRLCVIDDFTDAGRPADLIINYVLPGRAQYVPLRSQFRDIRMPMRQEVRRVFVSTGGSDPYGMREALIDLVGKTLPEAEIAVAQGVDRMAAFMAECDLAVTAGGTTVYELCATGVPMILYTMADNQQSLARGLRDVIPDAGDVRDSVERQAVMERIARWMTDMARDPAARRDLSERERSVTDGRGAGRIAREILTLTESTR